MRGSFSEAPLNRDNRADGGCRSPSSWRTGRWRGGSCWDLLLEMTVRRRFTTELVFVGPGRLRVSEAGRGQSSPPAAATTGLWVACWGWRNWEEILGTHGPPSKRVRKRQSELSIENRSPWALA